jgi:hypothetical protein
MMHEDGIDHGRFIHDEEVAGQGVFLVLLKSSLFHAVFQEPVKGFGLMTRGFGHAFGGAPRWCGQLNTDA